MTEKNIATWSPDKTKFFTHGDIHNLGIVLVDIVFLLDAESPKYDWPIGKKDIEGKIAILTQLSDIIKKIESGNTWKDICTDILLTNLTKIIKLYLEFYTINRTRRPMIISKISKMEAKYNYSIVKMAKDKKYTKMFPTINPTINGPSHVKEALDNKLDSITTEKHKIVLSICSHKKTSGSYPCFICSPETLIESLKVWFDDPSLWIITSNSPVHGELFLMCPMKRSETCKNLSVKLQTKGLTNKSYFLKQQIEKKVPNHETSKCCLSPISMKKLLGSIPKAEKNYFQEKIPFLRMKICIMDYPEIVFYCKDHLCENSTKGFLYDESAKESNEKNSRLCLKCNKEHHIHAHRIECPKCSKTFCNCCDIIPYHEKQLCHGPVKLQDESILQILRETNAKLCPNCKDAVQLRDGCDHIQCRCGQHWCFRCERIFTAGTIYSHICISEEFLEGRISLAFVRNRY
jgi:hypothetical protein